MLLQVYLLLVHICVVLGGPQGDFYASDSNIYELTPSTFDKVVHKSNYTTIVEFYAPWCGYCNQLKPVYHKLGKFIQQDSKYAINVAAVNCDKNYNKPLCAEHQISGFPTLKVFRPPKFDASKPAKLLSKHMSEVYQGERGFKSMLGFLTSRIKNYVKKLHLEANINKWINAGGSNNYRYKVLLLTNSNSVTPMYKTLAIDFLNSINFAYTSVKEKLNTSTFIIGGEEIEIPIKESDKFPIVLLIDAESKTIERYIPKTKLSDKYKLTEWLMEKTNNAPIEGELSKKDKQYYLNYRLGKKGKKIVHDEL